MTHLGRVIALLVVTAAPGPAGTGGGSYWSTTRYIVPEAAAAFAERDDSKGLQEWAGQQGGGLARNGCLVAYRSPLRLSTGVASEGHGPDVWQRFRGQVSEAEAQALVSGRLLLLDRMSPNAALLLRSAMPQWCRPALLPVAPDADWLDAARRRHAASIGREPTGDEWEQASRSLRRDADRRWRIGAVPWLAAVGMEPLATARIETEDGKLLARPIELLESATTYAESWVAWDAASLVAVPDRPAASAAEARARIAATGGQPDLVQVAESGFHSLQELADRAGVDGPCDVAPEHAPEMLYVSTGAYEVHCFREAIQAASGLLWQPAADGLVLAPHPATLFQPPDAARELPAYSAWAADRLVDRAPYTREDLVAAATQPVRAWRDLRPEQQSWLAARSDAFRSSGGGYVTTARPVPAEALAAAHVRWQVGVACSLRTLVEVEGPTEVDGPTWITVGGNAVFLPATLRNL